MGMAGSGPARAEGADAGQRLVAPRPVFDPDLIARFCRQHHIRWLALFGSVLRDDFGP
jgi:hypothetical protein